MEYNVKNIHIILNEDKKIIGHIFDNNNNLISVNHVPNQNADIKTEFEDITTSNGACMWKYVKSKSIELNDLTPFTYDELISYLDKTIKQNDNYCEKIKNLEKKNELLEAHINSTDYPIELKAYTDEEYDIKQTISPLFWTQRDWEHEEYINNLYDKD